MRTLAALLVAPAAFAAVLVAAPPAEAASALQFRRIYANAPGSDTSSNTSVNGEYAVIKNTTSTKKCLSSWKVKDKAGHTYTFGTFCLAGYASVTLYSGKGTNSASRRYWGRSWHVWNNDGDTAYLRNSAGTLMDSCSWGRVSSYVSC